MIEDLPARELDWLARFFAKPNGLTWSSLIDGSAPAEQVDQIRHWLEHLADERSGVILVLPFVRGGKVMGWYATTQSKAGGDEMGDDIHAWLGPTWLSRFEQVPEHITDPMAKVLRDRFGGTVFRFTGADENAIRSISVRLDEYCALLGRKPRVTRLQSRPVGAVLSDFERALLAGDEASADAMIAELKRTGRLNEENLRYLEVRLSAGLGLWPQIARNHWLIKALTDLALPPQILADIVEALYRTYIDEVEATGDAANLRDAFIHHIAHPYPKLFASRRGIRSPRVVKAFILFEQLQLIPDVSIVNDLLGLLPAETNTSLFEMSPLVATAAPITTSFDEADEAFDNGQFDRAFEFYLRLPLSKKTISRLVSCVGTIGTHEVRDRFLTLLEGPEQGFYANLAPTIEQKIEGLRQARATNASLPLNVSTEVDTTVINPWIRWAEQLKAGHDIDSAERDVQSAPTNWDATAIKESRRLAQKFAGILGGLSGEASTVARASVPQIYNSFFPDGEKTTPSAKPIASLLFLLIAMDESLSRADLDLLAHLTSLLIEQGLSSAEYVSLMSDVEDVQKRISSYSYLSWSLDVSEALAILPCPSEEARDARLRVFMNVLDQAARFVHRLAASDLVPLKTLVRDYGVGPEAISALKVKSEAEGSGLTVLPSLDGKTIGIYTLAEAAGSRAKAALEDLFPGCKVVVNSDLVATSQLTSLARAADIFVFAWKSSSHQAFYCVKDALAGKEPIWAPGKGTASILRAVLDHLS